MKKRLLLLFLLLLAAGLFANAPDFPTGHKDFLREKGIGIEEMRDLRLTKTESTEAATHFVYQQYYRGFPVVGGQVLLNFDKQNRLLSAHSSFKKLRRRLQTSFHIQPALTNFGPNALVENQGVWILAQDGKARPVWRLHVEPNGPGGGSWLFYVDCERPNITWFRLKTYASFEGQGNVWLENPLITPERKIETFPNMDATKKLSGRFVKVFDGNFEEDAIQPLKLSDYTTASDSQRQYNYAEQDARLTEAMAYFHINRVHDQWNSFGFRGLDAKAGVFVNIAGVDGGPGYDNAHYERSSRFRRTGIYVFGSGNQFENTGLDGEIYYHEYGHGVLDRIKPELLESFDSVYPSAFHEAFGDISAAALSGNSRFADFGFRLKGTTKFNGRNLNNKKRFPKDVIWPAGKFSEPHHTCLILDGAWWDLQKLIGRQEAQRILYNAVRLLPTDLNFFDVKEAMLIADRTLNGGANGVTIEQSFSRHGLVGADPGQNGDISVQNLLTAVLPPSSFYELTSSFRKGETVNLITEYTARGLSPGYWLVPVDLQIQGPPGSSPLRTQLLIREVFNGPHLGLQGLYFAEISTDSSSASGSYTITLQGRLGGTQKILPAKSVTFQLN